MTTLLGILLLSLLVGFGAAFAAKAYREGRPAVAFLVGVVIAAIVAFLAWQAAMIGLVGPAMSRS